MRIIAKALLPFFYCILLNCNSTGDRTDSPKKIAEYRNPTQDFKVDTGLVQFDLTQKNMTTHNLNQGSNIVFVYERTGVTMIDTKDWEAKYTETLIIQLDSSVREFEYCDTSLKKIDCKYYWICLAKEIKKEIIDIEKGCIKGLISSDSITIDIDINPEFGFGGFLKNGKDRVIKYKTMEKR